MSNLQSVLLISMQQLSTVFSRHESDLKGSKRLLTITLHISSSSSSSVSPLSMQVKNVEPNVKVANADLTWCISIIEHWTFSLLWDVDSPQRKAISLRLQENLVPNLSQTMNGFSEHFHIGTGYNKFHYLRRSDRLFIETLTVNINLYHISLSQLPPKIYTLY